jgi:hypothetical protein
MVDLLTWTPAGLFLGVVGIVTVPFLGVLVVLTLVLGAFVALGGAIVVGSYELAHTIGRRWRTPSEAAVRVPAQASRASRARAIN